MHSSNRWGGSLEIQSGPLPEEDQSSNTTVLDRETLLGESQEGILEHPGWLLHRTRSKKVKYVDLGIVVCKREMVKWVAYSLLIAFVVVGLPIIIYKALPKHKAPVPVPDEYTVALHVALKFFNAQKSGRLPKNNGVPWRGNSGLQDGSQLSDVKEGLVGGYYDSGNNIKFHFPMAFTMTLLSWSVIEYGPKYEAMEEYSHVRDIIKWGIDYLLLTFNSSAPTISKMYSQVGVSQSNSTNPDDGYCWQRPEDMDYPRPVQTSTSAPDLGSEVAAALAAASLVFQDDNAYSEKLVQAAKTAYIFATGSGHQAPYSLGNPVIDQFYNSTGYWDEFIWASAWLYYATGNYSYLAFATNPSIYKNADVFPQQSDSSVFSWDNKLPGAQLLLSRLRIFLNPGYPYEDMLREFHLSTDLNMCSYFRQFHVFNWTRGGLIQLNHGRPRPLQYIASAAFLASLYADYMNASKVPGWHCGPYFFSLSTLRTFATSQVNYILGANPRNISYLVGYGDKYPKHVRHRGASTPNNGRKYSCTGGWKWRDSKAPNPNVITGAMVGGPDRYDRFSDVRHDGNYTEPTLAGNAGLVAALVSLTGSNGGGIDKNTMFSYVAPIYPNPFPPPSPWKP